MMNKMSRPRGGLMFIEKTLDIGNTTPLGSHNNYITDFYKHIIPSGFTNLNNQL